MKTVSRFFINALLLLMLFQIEPLVAQQQTASPYSSYGIGNIEPQQNIRGRGMGGISIGIRNPYEINSKNAASYTAFDSLSFVFDAAFQGQMLTVASDEGSIQDNTASISYLAVGMPVTNWWRTSVGLMPYSAVGYNLVSQEVSDQFGDIDYYYNGDGGSYVFYWGNGLKVTEELSFGFNLEYIFGNMNYQSMVAFSDTTNIWNTRLSTRSHFEGLSVSAGVQYYKELKNSDILTFGVTGSNRSSLSAKTDLYVETLFGGIEDGVEYNLDTLYVINKKNGDFVLPMEAGFGFSWERPDNFVLGFDLEWNGWSDFSKYGINDSLQDSYRAAVGFEFIPNSSSVTGYLSNIRYRVGATFEHQGLQINNNSLESFSGTFGLGLPLPRSHSTVNLAVEVGQRGSLENNLVKETFVNFSVGMSLAEFWFMKRKYK